MEYKEKQLKIKLNERDLKEARELVDLDRTEYGGIDLEFREKIDAVCDSLLGRSLLELSLDELETLKKVLEWRFENIQKTGEALKNRKVTKIIKDEKVMQLLFDSQKEDEKSTQDIPSDLQIIDGLIAKKREGKF